MAESPPLNLIFDADDTLWDSNIHFLEAQESFVAAVLEAGIETERAQILGLIRDCELAIIESHGYGRGPYVRALHHAVERLSDLDELRARVRLEVERIGSRLMARRCELLPGVEPTLRVLATRHRLLLFTKGQPGEQLHKLEASGLAALFNHVGVPREKDVGAYRRLIVDAELAPERSYMIGNSPRSDINPALKAGLRAVYIPHPHTWELEHEELDLDDRRVTVLSTFPRLLEVF